MPETRTHPSICRFCHAHCAVLVDVEDGRAVRVLGDRENPRRSPAVPGRLEQGRDSPALTRSQVATLVATGAKGSAPSRRSPSRTGAISQGRLKGRYTPRFGGGVGPRKVVAK